MSQPMLGKVALITGGSSGIGAATVMRLARDGAKVIFTGRSEEAGAKVAMETGAEFYQHDVQDADGWDQLNRAIAARYDRLDICFANAGTEAGDASVEDIELSAWQHVIGINQTGVMLAVQHAVRLMRDNQDGPTGSIIINSSMNANKAMGNYVAYSVSKAAVVALAKSAAIHCASKGYKIRVNAILPGVVETEMIQNVIARSPDPAAARAMFEAMAPMGRMAQLDEVSALISFLASDAAAFMSGGEYSIDGASTAGMLGV